MEIQKIKVPEQDRKLVSVFMDEEFPEEIDFNWLMPVVEKIEKDYEVKIEDVFCEITLNDGEGSCTGTIDKDGDTKIEAVWLAVVFFIKWYNQNK